MAESSPSLTGDEPLAGGLAPELIAEERKAGLVGASPWQLARRRLRRDRGALAAGAIFLLLVLSCLAAPLWADHVAHRDYDDQPGTGETVEVDGEQVEAVSIEGIPIGPTWRGEYFLGADGGGRDVMVRLLYGGRNSLVIGIGAALATTLMAIFFGLVSGFFRGRTDTIISGFMDIIWAFPVILLGVALGTALALGGLKIGPLELSNASLALPAMVIAFVYIPYLARPIRGEVMALREREFVQAARVMGMPTSRILFKELLPNLAAPIIISVSLMLPAFVAAEAGLAYLGIGVTDGISWGQTILKGTNLTFFREYPQYLWQPLLGVVALVLALNLLGDALRDALDPKTRR